jgi:hypothetical protein
MMTLKSFAERLAGILQIWGFACGWALLYPDAAIIPKPFPSFKRR